MQFKAMRTRIVYTQTATVWRFIGFLIDSFLVWLQNAQNHYNMFASLSKLIAF
jgi:hypothetical protein